ncbi:MAG: SphA family protein [Candidatus Binataceae bacterium]
MGTAGVLAAQQAPEGIFYTNLWSWYHASNSSFLQTGPIKCGPIAGRVCLSANFNASGNLDMFVDQNFLTIVTPFKILGATYGFLVDVPFAIAGASGSAALEPVLTARRGSVSLNSLQASGAITKGSIGDIYFQPIDLGWRFKQLDAIASAGFLAPTGAYNAAATVNIGYGHWTGLFGLGAIAYADPARTWSLSLFSHYETYASQEGRPYTLGDEALLEWGAAKTFNLPGDAFKQFNLGAVGYAQWQTTDNQINVSPATAVGSTLVHRIVEAKTRIYAAGPALSLLTKFGLFNLRYYEEFGAQATPSGSALFFSYSLGGKPW